MTLSRTIVPPSVPTPDKGTPPLASARLAGQTLEALAELACGVPPSRDALHTPASDPDSIYRWLLALVLRLVFLLLADARPQSLTVLLDQLRLDASRSPDRMDQSFRAWPRLLQLAGAYDGAAPRMSDRVVLRVLEKLLLLDGMPVSYPALDAEHLGSVYERLIGLRPERAPETCIAVGKDHALVGLETLLALPGADRAQHVTNTAGAALPDNAAKALRNAANIETLVRALGRRLSPLTPRPVPRGGLVLRPADDRRRSGAHYTPRALTEPLVRMTLRPILENLGPHPDPDRILAIKLCDPAMGSGAFLIEACRQLGDELAQAYARHGRPSGVAAGGDIVPYARRQIAQHCLYGVDKDPVAVDLARLSLRLACGAPDDTLAFLDHAIRHGDSLGRLALESTAPVCDDGPVPGARPFFWYAEFPEVFAPRDPAMNDRSGFDAVVGNPPYLFGERRPPVLEPIYRLAAGQWDVCWLFLERTTSLLRDGGAAGLVLPDGILAREEPGVVREFVREHYGSVAADHAGTRFDAAVSVFLLGAGNRGSPTTTISYRSSKDGDADWVRVAVTPDPAQPWVPRRPAARPACRTGERLRLEDCAWVSRGEEIGKKALVQADSDRHPGLVEALAGAGVHALLSQPQPTGWVRNSEVRKDPAVYAAKKLVVVKTGRTLRVGIDRRGLVTLQSIYNVRPKTRQLPLEFLAALLASNAVNDAYVVPRTSGKDVFPQITQGMVGAIEFVQPTRELVIQVVARVRAIERQGGCPTPDAELERLVARLVT